MNFELLDMPAVVLVVGTASALLASRDWRSSLVILALQYLGVFLLIAVDGLLPIALAKLMAGGMAAAVLFMALSGLQQQEAEGLEPDRHWRPDSQPTTPSGLLFRLLAVGIVGLAVASLSDPLVEALPEIRLEQSWGGLILIGLGLLHLGLTVAPFRIILGLLTVLSGFEILYSAVEISALVTGLLAGVTLGLALVGAYLLIAPAILEEE